MRRDWLSLSGGRQVALMYNRTTQKMCDACTAQGAGNVNEWCHELARRLAWLQATQLFTTLGDSEEEFWEITVDITLNSITYKQRPLVGVIPSPVADQDDSGVNIIKIRLIIEPE